MKLKTLIVAIAAAFCALFATGCADSPGEVVKDYASKIDDMDFKAAKELCTGDLRQQMGEIDEEISKLSGEEKEKAKKVYKELIDKRFKGIEILSEDIDGDNATVKIKNSRGDEATVKLKKVDGKWKVSSSN